MGISVRHYVLQEDGALRRVAGRVVEAMAFGRDAIPEYANSRQRVVQVIVESENGRPVRILDATGHFWDFDEDGKIDDSLRKTMAEYMDVAFARPTKKAGTVVDLVPEIKGLRRAVFHRDISALVLRRINPPGQTSPKRCGISGGL